MCGIVGIKSLTKDGEKSFSYIDKAVKELYRRGPDNQSFELFDSVALGHARLSIIDTSESAHQPFTDSSGDYVITFNGEIYNYLEIKRDLEFHGYTFKTSSDTEVLLYSFIAWGKDCLNKLNGFFAFCIYNKKTRGLFIARDRYGIKPLHVYTDYNKIIWASELKAILAFDIIKKLDYNSLGAYFKLNYIPKDMSIFENVKKLLPGQFITISETGDSKVESYYSIEIDPYNYSKLSYDEAKKELDNKLRESVEKRLVSDVPLGCFLSGGIDSSIISGIASEVKPDLNTFSIGFADEPLFDETSYAELVAKKFKTNHHVFKLKNDDFLHSLDSFEKYIDEPFADSSALAVNVLAERTKPHVTVSLSGDGADELFSGYNKHHAEYMIRQNMPLNKALKMTPNIWKYLPQSRNSKLGDLFRKLDKFSQGLSMNQKERYWAWIGLTSDEAVKKLLNVGFNNQFLKKDVVSRIGLTNDFNDYLWSDLELVLPGDMLTKVDLMSMNNSLEVRVPFLDHELVNFVNTLPANYKIDKGSRKKILQDTYRSFLPEELYHRPKHGFEVPLLKWFKGPLRSVINDLVLNKEFILSQGVFNYSEIRKIVEKLRSSNPGDTASRVWAILVFQFWWKKYLDNG
jgi:asparagine synthase (glutamine-hydrolysing)